MTQKDIITLSPEGYIAIPARLRKGFKGGDPLLIIRDDNRLILERVSEMDDQLKEDLEFARRTEEAWKEIDRGEGTEMDFEEFLNEIEKW